MSDIYEDALADAQRLREAAEKNATNAIVEAVKPKIRSLIESQLIAETHDEPDDEQLLLEPDSGDVLEDVASEMMAPHEPPVPKQNDQVAAGRATIDPSIHHDAALGAMPAASPLADDPVMPSPEGGFSGGEPAGMTLPDQEGKITLDMDSIASPASGDEYVLNAESLQMLHSLLSVNKVDAKFETRVRSLRKKVSGLIKENTPVTFASLERMRQIRTELENMYGDLQESREYLEEDRANMLDEKLERLYKAINERYDDVAHLGAFGDATEARRIRARRLAESKVRTKNDLKKYVIGCFKLMKECAFIHSSLKKFAISLEESSSIKKDIVSIASDVRKLYMEVREMTHKNGKLVNEASLRFELELPDDLGEIDLDAVDINVIRDDEGEEIPGGEELGDEDMGDVPLGDMDDMGADEDLEEDSVEFEIQGLPGEDDGLDSGDVDIEVVDDEAGEDAGDMEDVGGEEGEEDDMELHDNDIVEISESMLRKELARMRRLREGKDMVNKGGNGAGRLQDFGGGKAEGEPFVDNDDSDLNKLSEMDELLGFTLTESDMDESDDMSEAETMDEADDCEMDESDDVNESEMDENEEVSEAEAVEENRRLKKKLAEQKLFNVKMLYANKLLQKKGLTRESRKHILETLDGAKSLREVEILAKSLSRTVGPMKESRKATRVIGSSSKATKSSSGDRKTNGKLVNEQVDRWQLLAGIPGEDE